MNENILELQVGEWVLKVRQPAGESPHPVIFLIHGWTGDERSMWVFAPRLPKEAMLIAPRAPFISRHPDFGGYSWVENRPESFSPLAAFEPALDSFSGLVDQLNQQLSGDFTRFNLAGFSQGAEFSFALALRHPERVGRLASLAGFLPAESEEAIAAGGLKSKPIFIAHGTQDETVPIDMARDARQQLEAAGAQVSYCESDTGHKLGANCARELQAFFADA
jgi:phospholipase/carboxylesterase